MATVGLQNIRKRFGSTSVLHGVNLEIEDGQFVVLVGPSGCGKSTLLRIIAGLEDPTEGDILIGGRIVSQLPPKERNIAMVFQSYALYPHMNVYENMSLSLRLSKLPKAEIDEKVRWAAGVLNLSELLERLPAQLSGGQRQRVAMGRAIVRHPDVFLFDEPLSNLDAKLRVQMRAEIRELHQNLKATTVYVTHDQIEAMTMADRIVVMDEGDVLQVGSPFQVYDTPANIKVAKFIGSPSMNLFNATVDKDERSLRIDDHHFGTIAEEQIGACPNRVIVGVRPEDLRISSMGHGLPVTVRVVEPTGPDTIVLASSNAEEISLLLRDRARVSVGETIHLSPVEGKLHLFDTETENRIG